MTDMAISQVYCLGRNYSDHARELGNPVLNKPLIFIKPSSCVIGEGEILSLPDYGGEVHHEVELAVQINRSLLKASRQDAELSIHGYAVCLDMTLRELQSELKAKSHPWAIAKGFPQSLPMSKFIPASQFSDIHNSPIQLLINDKVIQSGNLNQMQVGIVESIQHVSNFFQLEPGDVILTGTPKGVGPVVAGDKLLASIGTQLTLSISVAAPA